jgi:purine-binding chemotaxis protein CheW
MSETLSEKRRIDDSLAGKYLTFALGSEFFCVPLLKVREIIRLTHITLMPQVPAHICGVINLRGKIIPVMDLRRRLGIACTEATVQSCILIVQIQSPAGKSSPMGMIVDAVEEVINIRVADLEPIPEVGAKISPTFILGMARIKDIVKTVLDIDAIVSAEPPEGSSLAGPSLLAA